MGAPMAGFGPMAFSPFPYGAPASSGVPSGMFVDLFNAQTVGGRKSYVITHQDATVDVLAIWSLTEDTDSSLNFITTTGTNGFFRPGILGMGSGSSRPGIALMGRGVTDSGASPLVQIDASIGSTKVALGSATSVTVRPCIDISNNNALMARFTAAGSLTLSFPLTHKSYTVATLPSAAIAGQEVYVSDAAVAPCLAFTNGTNWKRCDNAATTVV